MSPHPSGSPCKHSPEEGWGKRGRALHSWHIQQELTGTHMADQLSQSGQEPFSKEPGQRVPGSLSRKDLFLPKSLLLRTGGCEMVEVKGRNLSLLVLRDYRRW